MEGREGAASTAMIIFGGARRAKRRRPRCDARAPLSAFFDWIFLRSWIFLSRSPLEQATTAKACGSPTPASHYYLLLSALLVPVPCPACGDGDQSREPPGGRSPCAWWMTSDGWIMAIMAGTVDCMTDRSCTSCTHHSTIRRRQIKDRARHLAGEIPQRSWFNRGKESGAGQPNTKNGWKPAGSVQPTIFLLQ